LELKEEMNNWRIKNKREKEKGQRKKDEEGLFKILKELSGQFACQNPAVMLNTKYK